MQMKTLFDYPDRICLNGMSFHGYTGVFDFEKQEGQTFLVDLTLCFVQINAVKSDSLTDTVHYGEVFAAVKNVVETSGCNLIEHLSGQIIMTVFEKFPLVQAAEVVVSKPNAPVEGVFDTMSVRIFRERSSSGRAVVREL
jgi:dihydroneopterin aldolase